MNALRLKLWMTLAFVMLTVAVPGVIARHALGVVRAQHARSEASSQSLSAFQRLAVLGYTLQQERYVDPEGFAKDRLLYIDGVRSHVTNAERYINAEIRLISETPLDRRNRAKSIEEEVKQRAKLHVIGANLEKSLMGDGRETLWEDLVFEAIKVEEREAKEYQRSSIETFQSVSDTLFLTVSVVGIFGILALI